MTHKTDDRTIQRPKPQRAETAERPKTERPAEAQRQPQRFGPRRTPRLPAYVRHG